MNTPVLRLRTPEERVGTLPHVSLPPPPPALVAVPDEEWLLMRALRDRDESAFARVLDLYHPAMLRIARSHVRSQATAEEVVQDTWLAALDGIDRFEGRAALKTWLFRILRNIARGRGRRDDRMRSFSDLSGEANDPIEALIDDASSRDPEQKVLDRELGQRIDAAIATLPTRQQEVIVLRDVEGWSAEEVCNVLGVSDTNQRVLLHRARERVRKALRDYIDEEGGSG